MKKPFKLRSLIILSLFFLLFSIVVNAQEPMLMLPLGHTNQIHNANFSADDKFIVTASEDFTAKIWSSRDGYLIQNLVGHAKAVMNAEFSPDAKLVATASWDNTAKIWSVLSGDSLFTLKHEYRVRDLKFSKDGTRLYTITDDEFLRCWDTTTGKLVFKTEGHTEGINDIVLSPDGTKLLTASSDKTAIIWDAATGKLILKLSGHKESLNTANFSPDGKAIVTASDDFTVKTWDPATGNLLFSFAGDKSRINAAKFSPDSKNLVISTRLNYSPKVFDLATGKLKFVLKGNTREVIDAAYFPEGNKIITIGYDQPLRIWDASNGILLKEIKDAENAFYKFCFAKGGSELLGINAENQVQTWDVKNLSLKNTFTGHSKILLNAEFAKDGKSFITATDGAMVKKWETLTGKLQVSYQMNDQGPLNSAKLIDDEEDIFSFTETGVQLRKALDGTMIKEILLGENAVITSAQVSPDQKTLLTTGFWNAIPKVWDLENKKLLLSLKGHESKYGVDIASYSPNGDKILTASTGPVNDKLAKLWDAKTGNLIHTFKGHTFEIKFAKFSTDGKNVITAGADNVVKKWDVNTGELIFDFEGYMQYVSSIEFSPDGKSILAAGQNGVKLWDLQTGKLIYHLTAHTDFVRKAIYSPDGKKLLTFSDDQSIKIWDAAAGKQTKNILVGKNTIFQSVSFELNRMICKRNSELIFFDLNSGNQLYALVALNTDDFILTLPSGYYMSTPNAAKLLYYVTKDLKVITFDQLDIRYNRPDKVLQAIGSTDTALIQSYKKTYEKRIKKLGIDTASFKSGYSVPEADFSNRAAIALDQQKQELSVHIKGRDENYNLDRFNVWVNENPIFGMRGINLKGKNTKEIDTTIVIKLSDGTNFIETSVTNSNGAESYKIPLTINFKPSKPSTVKLYFVGIGIDEYVQSQNNLQWSVKDIRDQAKALKVKYGDQITIDTLFNQQVTVSNVIALKDKLKTSEVNDKVIIAYSGHGLLNAAYDYFLSTFAVNFDKPEQNGLAYEALENLLDQIPARQKLMLIDACHSGELDKDEIAKINTAAPTLAANKTQGGKGVKVINTGAKKADMKTSLELMQQLFVNVGKSTGATVISASAGTQFALEKNDLKNGVFSYSILEFMQTNPHAKVADLKKYVNKRVVELTAGLQVPTTRNETKNLNWEVW
ncbi:MAG: hypothetical protein EOP00_06960 [Pedobacter sp.]|nr:MAG: hypothetical protein EOP00_06960 [Pedobacter sp.]